MDSSSIDLKKLLCVTSATDKPTKEPERITYSKDTLLILSRNAPCQIRPDCLSEKCFGPGGRWDPEKWHNTFDISSSPEGGRNHHETREESNVVLGPQRRSFQGGCHVASKEKTLSITFTRSGLNSSGSKISERSLKVSRQEEPEHPPQYKRFHSLHGESSDWSKKDSDGKKSFEKMEPSYNRRTRNNEYKRFSSTAPPSRKYSESNNYRDHHRDYYEELEPEWISYGPKSQFDTVELSGFEDADDFGWMGGEIPMDDVPDRKKKEPQEKENRAEKEKPIKEEKNESPSEDKPLSQETESSNKPEETEVIEPLLKLNEPVASEQEKSSQEIPVSLPLNKEFFATDPDSSQGSRFRHWFNSDSPITPEQKMVNDLTSDLTEEKNEQTSTNVPATDSPRQPEKADTKKTEAKQPNNPRPTDLHGADAFNRLIASIRATDKQKEQMQERNQKIQALQNMMKASKQRNTDTNCFNLTAIENSGNSGFKNLQSNALKQQFEKRKDVYQQKLRKIEQQQKSSPSMIPGQDVHSLQGMPGFSGQHSNDAVDERKAATASLAAKLAGKGKKSDSPKLPSHVPLVERLYSNPGKTQTELLNEKALLEQENLLKRLHSNSAEATKNKASNTALNSIKNNSLLIAQMLASAGVTEEQLKQLTLEQQELVITMVQNQFSQKDIGKFLNSDSRGVMKTSENSANINLQTRSLTSNIFGNRNAAKEMYTTNSLPVTRDGRMVGSPNTPSTTNVLSLLTENADAHTAFNESNSHQAVASSQAPSLAQVSAAQSRLLPHTVMPVHRTLVSPVVPLISPNIAPHVLTAAGLAAPPHMAHLVQNPPSLAPPHPALLLQMQQQMYANQLAAAQQQQQAVLAAALQKQHLAAAAQANNAAKLQQNIQNMRIASHAGASDSSSAQDRSHFNNPLAQWFSRDVLQQSQFPPVSQLTGQQTLNSSNNPHVGDMANHTMKH